MNWRHLTPCTLLLLLTGCAPNATVYYRPSVDGGKVVAAHCVPTQSNIDFQVGSLPFRARANEGQNATIVSLTPSKSSWKTFHFTTANFAMRNLGSGVTTRNLMVRVMRHDKSDSIIEPFHAQTAKGHFYWLDVYLPRPTPENFEILSPPIMVDDQEFQFPPIRFERKGWMGISPFNC